MSQKVLLEVKSIIVKGNLVTPNNFKIQPMKFYLDEDSFYETTLHSLS